MSENKKKYYIGIDLGGTFIKGGIVDEKGSIVVDDKIPTESEKGGEKVMDNIASLVEILLKKAAQKGRNRRDRHGRSRNDRQQKRSGYFFQQSEMASS